MEIFFFADVGFLIATAMKATPSSTSQMAYSGLTRGSSTGGTRNAEPSVVVTVRVEITELAPTVTELGESPQFAWTGEPLQVSDTVPVKSLIAVIVMVDVAEPPAETVAALEEAEIAKSGKFPDRGTVWGLPAALSLILTLAFRNPVAVGVKVTSMLHVSLAFSVLGNGPQVFVCA